ncbi:MAG: hypothetical protein B7Z55_00300 [Planctomycetales bacterium 12-60-4]|nr:MAG: hypothetical protein B7Z55_00300 [Planctomycetales bacterium 12-60-4]
MESEESHGVDSPCEHHGGHDGETPSSPRDHSSHHLCVATHLFYLARSDAGSQLPDLSWVYAVFPLLDAVIDLQVESPRAIMASHSVVPTAASQLRAVLGVWIV